MRKLFITLSVLSLSSCYQYSTNNQMLDLSKIEVPDLVITTKNFDEKILNDTSVLIPFIIIKEGESLKISYQSHSCYTNPLNYYIVINKMGGSYFASLYNTTYDKNEKLVVEKQQDLYFINFLIDFSKTCKNIIDANKHSSHTSIKPPYYSSTTYEFLTIKVGDKEFNLSGSYNLIEPIINEILGKNKIWKS